MSASLPAGPKCLVKPRQDISPDKSIIRFCGRPCQKQETLRRAKKASFYSPDLPVVDRELRPAPSVERIEAAQQLPVGVTNSGPPGLTGWRYGGRSPAGANYRSFMYRR